jgi:predicted ArsR family transcriptional regulator
MKSLDEVVLDSLPSKAQSIARRQNVPIRDVRKCLNGLAAEGFIESQIRLRGKHRRIYVWCKKKNETERKV